MRPASRRDEVAEAEPPDLPGFRTWRGNYAFVFRGLLLGVLLLAGVTVVFA